MASHADTQAPPNRTGSSHARHPSCTHRPGSGRPPRGPRQRSGGGVRVEGRVSGVGIRSRGGGRVKGHPWVPDAAEGVAERALRVGIAKPAPEELVHLQLQPRRQRRHGNLKVRGRKGTETDSRRGEARQRPEERR